MEHKMLVEQCNDYRHSSLMMSREKNAEMEMRKKLMAASQVAARQFREVEPTTCETLGLHRSGKSADYGKKSIKEELDKMRHAGGWTSRPR